MKHPARALLVAAMLLTGAAVNAVPLIIEDHLAFAPVTAGDTVLPVGYHDDGPHIFWKNDSTAIMLYVCADSLVTQSYHIDDTLRFAGICADSSTEYVITVSAPEVEPSIFSSVSRFFAVSDIHGEYEHFVNILRNGGVIDQHNQWIWGDGHLVIDGDVFDRGAKVTECLWLIYRLEQQARIAGGRVHYILGNHETMVLTGDNRHVNERYLDGIVRKSRISHENLYGRDMELGRWLRTKHTIIRINDIVFVHGGLSPLLVEQGLDMDEINRAVRLAVDLNSAQRAFSDTAKTMLGSLGALWYRGFHEESEGRYQKITSAGLDSVLTYYGGATVVIGHTETDSLVAMYDGRVYAIDVPVQELGSLEALLWQDGVFYRVLGSGERRVLR